jgi:UDP-N-acetylmuramoyl-L-alanyl-D-glutamate--2,6-diaminopimelate ligase
MKTLNEILVGIDIVGIYGQNNISINAIYSDSRKVTDDSLFVAIVGNKQNGNEFIDNAIEKGAKFIVHNKSEKIENLKEGIVYIEVKDSNEALGIVANNFYENPSSRLKLVGVTGTNGKTTTATCLFDLFKNLGYKTALISTIENKINEEVFETNLTTPDPITIASFLYDANHKVEHDEEKDADRRHRHGCFVALDAGDRTEELPERRHGGDGADRHPKHRPQNSFPNGLLLPHDKAPRIRDE